MIRGATLAFLAGVLFPVRGAAETRVHLEAQGGTEVPVMVGAGADVELPLRLRVSGRIGVMPGAYVDLINKVSVDMGWYSESEARLIKAGLDNSMITGLELGVRPLARYGLYVGAGLTVAALGGSATPTELVEAVTGSDVNRPGRDAEVDMNSTLLLATGRVGYRFPLPHGLALRTELGGLWTLASSTSMSLGSRDRESEQLNREVHAYMNELYTQYVRSLTLAVYLGYRVF